MTRRKSTRPTRSVSVSAACHPRLRQQAERERVTIGELVERGMDAVSVLEGALERAKL